MEDEVLGLGPVLAPFPRDTDSEMEIAWRKFIAEGTQDQHLGAEWVGGVEEAALGRGRLKQ